MQASGPAWQVSISVSAKQNMAEEVVVAACLGVKLHTRHVPGRARVLQRCRGGTNCRRAAA